MGEWGGSDGGRIAASQQRRDIDAHETYVASATARDLTPSAVHFFGLPPSLNHRRNGPDSINFIYTYERALGIG
jgi:hypothetical protein